MAYAKEVTAAASAALAKRRDNAEREAGARRAAFYAACPRGEEIQHVLAGTAIAAGKAVLSGKDVREQLTRLKASNQALQAEQAALLAARGMSADALEPRYTCADCEDSGYIDGRRCDCLSSLLREEACRQLSALTPLGLCSFKTFDPAYYDGDPETGAAMRRVLESCRRYARDFSPASPSLIFMGGTGLGKTHLSLAIANEVLQRGVGVVYGSVGNFVERLEAAHFGRAADENTAATLQSCDLLILDDLGTEFRTAFSTAEIYRVVNTRQMAGKPTIISTNLSMKELEERYSERFASRILGGYTRLLFKGGDVRLQKRMRRATGSEAL